MELNREQIIKALARCCDQTKECHGCEFKGMYGEELYCFDYIKQNALALIKELTEENERLKSVEFTCGFVKPHKVLECPIFDEIARTKADTVRKMQERLKEHFDTYTDEGEATALYMRKLIDQIAKEMLEGCDG